MEGLGAFFPLNIKVYYSLMWKDYVFFLSILCQKKTKMIKLYVYISISICGLKEKWERFYFAHRF